MKRKVGRLRLSPNEEAQLIKEEHERRRKLRLQQVREQERCIALQIRKEVQRRRDCELQNLADQLQEEWQRQQREKLQDLEKLYQDSLQTLGEGHRNAKENEPDLEAMAQKAEEQHERAAERHREALRVLKTQRLRQQEEQSRHIQARRKAMLVEKERAAKVASLPPPLPEPFEKIEAKKPPPVKVSDVDNFTVTHFHMPETAVDREEDTAQPDARRAAEEEGRRLEDLGKEEERERRERLAKARLRGSHALRKEHLYQDRERLLQELEHMQQADLLRRRQAVSQMPPQTFQPLYSRQEMREDRQRDLEFAFEDMYTGERRMKGDLVLQLVPEPLPALSSDTHDDDLDVTLEPDMPPAAEQQALDHQSPLPPTEAQAEPAEGAPPHALKKLLNKIRNQRSQWSSRAGGDMTADGMTIESGSLASGDRVGRPPPDAPPPDHLQPSQGHETTEESIIAGTLVPPKMQAVRISLAAEERRKQAEELEKQKQEQIELLQQLEEERRTLQLQMQQAQLEKERLQIAVQGNPEKCVQQEVPAHQEEVPSTSSVLPEGPEPQSSAMEDAEEHSRRVRQYQQRLLDQNRQHKQSVEDARRRLAEYQHALKMKYSRALMATLNPPGFQNLPHLRAAPPLVPPTGVLLRPCAPTALSPSATPLPPSTALPQQGPAPVPGRGAVPNLPFGLSHMHSSDTDVPSQSLSSVLALDPPHVKPVPLPRPVAASEWPLQEPPAAEHGLETQWNPPALPQVDARPPSCQPLPVDPAFPALEPARPAPASAAEPGPDPDPRRRELLEARQRVEKQRSAVQEQQRAQEERLLLQQSQLREQMRRYREALDTFLSGSQSRPLETGSEVSREERLSLMSTLLRAIEESSGSLSQPQSDQPPSLSSSPTTQNQAAPLCHTALSDDLTSHSDLRSRAAAHPRAPKPPLARPRLGILEIIEQHELSAIQEVETPIDASLATVGEELEEVSCALTEEPSGAEDLPRAEAEHSSGSSTVTGRSSRLSWRERLQLESGSSPEPDAARASCMPQHSSDNGHGSLTHPGLMILDFKAAEEERMSLPCSEERFSLPSEQTPVEAECLSSCTISTGSFSANEPDFSSTAAAKPGRWLSHADASLPTPEAAGRGGALSPALRHSGSISSQGSLSPESLLGNDSLQRIIDKYTKELNTSLASAGSFAVVPSPAESSPAAWRAVLDKGGSSSSISLPWSRDQIVSEDWSLTPGHSSQETSTQNVCRSLTNLYLEDTRGGLGKSGLMGAVEDVSKCSFEGAQNSSCHFLPLEPRPDFDSSTSSSSRHSERQEQIRRPEASQVAGHLLDQSSPQYQAERRDSTRSIGDPSAQSTSHWLNEGRDITTMQSFSPRSVDSSSHLLGEGRLRTGEWEELSAGQHSGSSGGASGPFLSDAERGARAQRGESSGPASLGGASLLKPGSSHPRPDVPEATPTLTQQECQRSVQDIDSSKELLNTGVFQELSTGDTPALDDTADGDTTLVDPTSDSFHPLPAEVTQNETLHLSEQDLHSPGGSDVTPPTGAADPDSTLEQPPSPELLRAESRDPSLCPPPSPPGSLCLPPESRSCSRDSILTEALCAEDQTLTGSCLCSPPATDTPSLALPPERTHSDMSAYRKGDKTLALKDPESLATRTAAWDSVLEAGSGTGILEEPDLTLLNLTESTMQELSMEEEEETGAERKELSSDEIPKSVPLVEDSESIKHESLPSHAVMLLEFQWPHSNLQQAFLQKRQDFVQRSAKRLEELRARREEVKNSTLVNRPKISLQSQREKSQAELLAGGGKLKKVGEVRVCTPEHRKTEEAEMYQRTERLYNRLEEVKQQKEIRSRQESYAKNREKAKEFQKKTLQKLRAKQARH
ncbi:centrosomal protein of 295 kDa isoform X1 [Anguilla rostrata]|uniref:centrosomal protein of 295 kDa isoform X1 n=1 Tax=Anguilla rostrata TaxID=7938 RepID=UPI0030CEF5DB